MPAKGTKLYNDIVVHKYDINILEPGEILYPISDDVVPGIYEYYAVSNYGRVYHRYTKSFLKPGLSGSGYLFVQLSTEFGPKIIQIHRLVLMTFCKIDNPELYDVNHIDGCKTNNIITNLEWCTRSYNMKHAYELGLHKKTNSIINENIAIQICDLLSKNIYTNKQIAEIIGYPVNERIVSDIKKKSSWTSVTKGYIFDHRPGRKFSEEFVRNICEYFSKNPIKNITINDHCRNALKFYGYDSSDNVVDCLRKIYVRKYYTHISKDYIF